MKTLIETDRLILRALDESHWRPVLNFLEKGKDIFEKYEMEKVPLYYTELYQKSTLSQEYAATLSDRYVRYYVFLKDNPDVIIGTVSCGSITGEPYCCGTIGYKFDEDYWHKGYAREALRAVIEEVFGQLKLHRLMAYVMEDNFSSIQLLEAVGFTMEGYLEKNIKVNGVWTSHRLYGLLNPYEE
ncbi:MAG: GNAT family N-acetyltransferase [Lachnospiraceae bacterium]|nr:GNAT family N-acetyltransferase [Lachnospiraceae bacterium]